jgi:hypothetical protein
VVRRVDSVTRRVQVRCVQTHTTTEQFIPNSCDVVSPTPHRTDRQRRREMLHPRGDLLGQVFQVYLNHSLAWITVLLQDWSFNCSPVGSAIGNSGRKLEQHIRNVLGLSESVLCTSSGIVALLIVDRAGKALRCSIDAGRTWTGLSAATIRKAATIHRYSAAMLANMLIARFEGNADLLELWNVAYRLLDALSTDEYATILAAVTVPTLPAKPATIKTLDSNCRLLPTSARLSGLYARAACSEERKTWACDVIRTIAIRFEAYLPDSYKHVETLYRGERKQYAASSVLLQLAGKFVQRKEGCDNEDVCSILLTAVTQLLSPQVQNEMITLLERRGSTPGLYLERTLPQCESPFWYAKAQALIGEALVEAAPVMEQVEKLCRFADGKVFAAHLRGSGLLS